MTAFICFLSSLCHQMWFKTIFSQKKALSHWLYLYGFSPVCVFNSDLKLPFHTKGLSGWLTYMVSLQFDGASHKNMFKIFNLNVTFQIFNYFNYFCVNCLIFQNYFEIFQCIYMIFFHCVSSDTISDQIYVSKLYHTVCIYMVSLQCVS